VHLDPRQLDVDQVDVDQAFDARRMRVTKTN